MYIISRWKCRIRVKWIF